jgi:ArsR family transcriptional regulator
MSVAALPFPAGPLAASVGAQDKGQGRLHDTAASPPDDFAALTGAEDFAARALEAANFLKAFGHDGRLMILCYLASGQRSVGELETLLASRQAAVSQQLARLRMEGLVNARREAQTIYYSIRDPRVLDMLRLLKGMFCPPETLGPRG